MNEVYKDIKETCLRLLARRDHSRKELLNKLTGKGFDREDVLAVIDELAQQGWQDDQRYAQNYARYRMQKGYGPVRIEYELRQNAIDEIDLDAVLQAFDSSWVDLLEQVYNKKYDHKKNLDRNEWAKRSRFLLHRGFTGEMISALLDHLNINKNKF
ncbi:regulatory protein RecX [Methylobacter sp. YRD-M1]|uniref:regulatory protein RecX n=1 Tax=Methylobacter sp. YRD-M1 TaxID=2911520 RepID=UPI00227A1E02|nr:regulatory protein RecX [Methylobacter sp. YRD-M1]WAK00766.1 recombination regulator RecX [Methylobacter sp. YRD-M1]